MTLTLPEAYACLREHFGSHDIAAKHLGMTGQHYNALRCGRANMPKRTAEYIILKAQEISAPPSALSAQTAEMIGGEDGA